MIRESVIVIALFGAGVMGHAQSADDLSVIEPTDPVAVSAPQNPLPTATMPTSNSSVQRQQLYRSFFLYGASVAEGEGLPNQGHVPNDGAFILFQPRIELLFATRTFRVALNSSPVLSYDAATGKFEGVNGVADPTLQFGGEFSPRWNWTVEGGVTAGKEYARLYVNDQPTCSGGTCTGSGDSIDSRNTDPLPNLNLMSSDATTVTLPVNPSNLVVQNLDRNFVDSWASAGVRWERSRTESYSFLASEAYAAETGYEIVSGRLQASQDMSRTLSVSSFAMMHDFSYRDLHCVMYGTGGGFTWQKSKDTLIEGEAGPEYGSRECGRRLGLNFQGGVSTHVSSRSIFTFSAARDLNAVYTYGDRWFDTYLGALSWQFSPKVIGEMIGGFFHSGGPLGAAQGISGYILIPQIRWQISPKFALTGSYHYYDSSLSQSSLSASTFNHGFLLISLSWRPNTIRL